MRILKIDEKYSVELDDKNNSRPVRLLRYGKQCGSLEDESNWIISMVYALDEARNEIETLKSPVPGNY